MEKKIINYTVIDRKSIPELMEQVLKMVKEGWHLSGGVSCYSHKGIIVATNYLQALVKYED